jgi:hypothetical protein
LSKDTLGIHQFRIANLPDPTLYWGTTENKGKANIKEKRLLVKYPQEIPMSAIFSVESWKLIVENDTISGSGPNLTQAEELLKKVQKELSIEIETTVIGSDGIKRVLKGTWTVIPWKDEKDIQKSILKCSG